MSIHFNTTSPKHVGSMGNMRAAWFIETGHSAAAQYGLPSGLSEVFSDDTCWIEEEDYATLVERVFDDSDAKFAEWAAIAAGIYQAMKGKWYWWSWDFGSGLEWITPQHYGSDVPKTAANWTIGRIESVAE